MYYQGAVFGESRVDTSLPAGVAVSRVGGDESALPSPPAQGVDAPVGEAAPSGDAASGGITDAQRLEVVRDFLREVGYSEASLGTMQEMVLYTRGRSGI